MASLAGTALGAVGAGLWTDEGRDVLTRYGVSVLNQVVYGTAEVGEVAGTLTDGIEARDVVIRGEDGTLLAYLPEVVLQYRMLDLLSAKIALGRVVLHEPHINVVKLPNGRLNFEEVLGLGGSGGGGRKPLVAFRGAEIHNATVTIRTPTDEPTDDPSETEMGPNGLMRIRRVDNLNAAVSYARVSSPFQGENALLFDIDDLSARFSDPAMDIRSLTGRLEIDGDSIALDLSRLVFPETETTLEGALTWPEGPLQLALELDAYRLAANDARPFVDGLPWGLQGSGRLSIHSLNPDRIRVRISPLQLAGPGGGGAVGGRFGIVVDKGIGWTLEDTELSFDSLALDYLRPMVDTIPFFGRVSGELVAAGPRDSLDTRLSVWFRDSLVEGLPQTHVRGAGILDLDGGIRFSDFRIDSSDVGLSTVHRLLPSVGLRGDLALRGSLDGPWRDVTFAGAMQHRDGGLPESIARGFARLDSRTDTVGVWADLVLDSLNFAGIHRSYPSVPQRGVFGGELRLSGYADSLAFHTTLGGIPGRAELSGALTLLPGTRAVHDLSAVFSGLDVQALDPSSPPTELHGRVTGAVAAYDTAGVLGELAFAFDTSFVVTSPLDSVSGVVRFADSTMFMDNVEVWGPSLYAVAEGGLGLTPSRSDTLRVGLAVDSLGVIEPLVRDRFGSLNRDSLLAGVTGVARADITVIGSTRRFDAAVEIDVPFASSRLATLEGLDLRVQWPTAFDGRMSFDGTLDSAAVGRFHYSDLELNLDGRRNAASWSARARLGEDGSWVARGATRVDSGVTTIPIEFMGFLLPTHRWFLDSGAVVTIRETGYDFDSVSFASESGGSGLAIQGRIPRGGSPGSLTGALVGVPLTDAWGLAQLDPTSVGGRVSGSIGLSGTATDPLWRVSFQWNDGRLGSIPIPMTLEASADYENGRLTGDGAGWRLGERVLSLDFDLPVDLALEGADQRQLPGELAINATGDDIDLSVVGLLTPTITGAGGQLDLDVGITGSWQQPQLRGNASIAAGGASFSSLGVTYGDVEAELALSGDTILIDRLTIESGEGRAEFAGFVRLEELTRPILDVRVAASEFHLIDVPQVLGLTTSGGFALRGPLYGVTLTGQGTVTEGDLYFADLIEKQIINLEDTLYAALVDVDFIREQGLSTNIENRLLDSLRIDSLSVEMGSNVRLLSGEADIQLTGQLLVGKVADRYRVDGTLTTPRGTYQLPLGRGMGVAEFVVREFDVTGGQLQYFGTPDLNADVDIDGRYVVRTTKGEVFNVFVNVGGTLYAPVITLSSDVQPELPEDEIISYLLFNAPSMEALGGDELRYVRSLALGAFSSQVVTPLVSGLGLPLDYFRIRPPTMGLSGTEIALGWQLSEKTFVTLSPRICQQQQRGLTSNFAASLEYRFSPNWHFAASSDPVNACTFTGAASHVNRSQFGLDLFWEKRY
jgi:translocation and assembly module TamB